MSQETYRNAPIAEAALDIRVRAPKGLTADVLDSVRDDAYPFARPRLVKVEFKVGQQPGNLPGQIKGEVSNTPIGSAFASADQKQVFQVRTDGFTHNRLAPYVDWASFSGEARRLWTKYESGVKPERIELLGLNYLNQILVPLGASFEDYLKTYIYIPPELPQKVNTYNLSIQIPWPEDGILVYVSQALAPAVKVGFATMILNIQAFNQIDKSPEDVSDSDIWQVFDKLRDVKNAVFEGSITDLVRKEIR
jgi:uncharacterized protein (TIGR04255 family)